MGAFTPTVRVPAVPAVRRNRGGCRARSPGPRSRRWSWRRGTRAKRSCRQPRRRRRPRRERLARPAPADPRARRRRAPAGRRTASRSRPAPRRSSSRRAPPATPKGVELTRAGMEVMGRGYSAGLDADDRRPLARLPPAAPRRRVSASLARAFVTGVPWTAHDGFDLDRVARAPRAEGTTIVSARADDAAAPARRGRAAARVPARRRRRRAAARRAAGARRSRRACASSTRTDMTRDVGRVGARRPSRSRGVECASADDGGDPRARRTGDARLPPRSRRARPTSSTPDGWLSTGDVGAIDAGRPSCRVIDRRPEDRPRDHRRREREPDRGRGRARAPSRRPRRVRRSAIADEEWGERVVACVVPADETRPPSLDALRDFARTELLGRQAPARAPRRRGDPAQPRREAAPAARHDRPEADDGAEEAHGARSDAVVELGAVVSVIQARKSSRGFARASAATRLLIDSS